MRRSKLLLVINSHHLAEQKSRARAHCVRSRKSSATTTRSTTDDDVGDDDDAGHGDKIRVTSARAFVLVGRAYQCRERAKERARAIVARLF